MLPGAIAHLKTQIKTVKNPHGLIRCLEAKKEALFDEKTTEVLIDLRKRIEARGGRKRINIDFEDFFKIIDIADSFVGLDRRGIIAKKINDFEITEVNAAHIELRDFTKKLDTALFFHQI